MVSVEKSHRVKVSRRWELIDSDDEGNSLSGVGMLLVELLLSSLILLSLISFWLSVRSCSVFIWFQCSYGTPKRARSKDGFLLYTAS